MNIKRMCSIIALLLCVMLGATLFAAESNSQKSPYLIVEGRVSQIFARMLVIDGQQYPVSKFVRVFNVDENGQEMPMHTVVSIGRIDKARLYILGGKVERIIVVNSN